MSQQARGILKEINIIEKEDTIELKKKRRVSFFNTAKVREVPIKARKSVGGFEVPDLSSDRRQSGSCYGLTLGEEEEKESSFDHSSFEVYVKDDDGPGLSMKKVKSPSSKRFSIAPVRLSFGSAVDEDDETSMVLMSPQQKFENDLNKRFSISRVSLGGIDMEEDTVESVTNVVRNLKDRQSVVMDTITNDFSRRESFSSQMTTETVKYETPLKSPKEFSRFSIVPRRESVVMELMTPEKQADTPVHNFSSRKSIAMELINQKVEKDESFVDEMSIDGPSFTLQFEQKEEPKPVCKQPTPLKMKPAKMPRYESPSNSPGQFATPLQNSSTKKVNFERKTPIKTETPIKAETPTVSLKSTPLRPTPLKAGTPLKTTPGKTFTPLKSILKNPKKEVVESKSLPTTPKEKAAPVPVPATTSKLDQSPRRSPRLLSSKKTSSSSIESGSSGSLGSLSPLHAKVLIGKSPKKRHRASLAGKKELASTPLKKEIRLDEEEVKREEVEQPEILSQTTEVTETVKEIEMTQLLPESQNTIKFESLQTNEANIEEESFLSFNEDSFQKEFIENEGFNNQFKQLISDLEMDIEYKEEDFPQFQTEDGTMTQAELEFYEKMCSELEYMIQRDEKDVEFLEKEVELRFKDLKEGFDSEESFMASVKMAQDISHLQTSQDWLDFQMLSIAPLQMVYNQLRVDLVEKRFGPLNDIKEAVHQVCLPIQTEFTKLDEEFQRVKQRADLFPKEKEQEWSLLQQQTELLNHELEELREKNEAVDKNLHQLTRQHAIAEKRKAELELQQNQLRKELSNKEVPNDESLQALKEDYELVSQVLGCQIDHCNEKQVVFKFRNFFFATFDFERLIWRFNLSQSSLFYDLVIKAWPVWFPNGFHQLFELKQIYFILEYYEKVQRDLNQLNLTRPVTLQLKDESIVWNTGSLRCLTLTFK